MNGGAASSALHRANMRAAVTTGTTRALRALDEAPTSDKAAFRFRWASTNETKRTDKRERSGGGQCGTSASNLWLRIAIRESGKARRATMRTPSVKRL